MQGRMTDRKWLLGYFERKHIIQSYGPSLIRWRSPEVPNLTRTARRLEVIHKLFPTEPLSWHLPKFWIPIQISPPWPMNSCLVALIQADSQHKINLSCSKKKAKSCWKIFHSSVLCNLGLVVFATQRGQSHFFIFWTHVPLPCHVACYRQFCYRIFWYSKQSRKEARAVRMRLH